MVAGWLTHLTASLVAAPSVLLTCRTKRLVVRDSPLFTSHSQRIGERPVDSHTSQKTTVSVLNLLWHPQTIILVMRRRQVKWHGDDLKRNAFNISVLLAAFRSRLVAWSLFSSRVCLAVIFYLFVCPTSLRFRGPVSDSVAHSASSPCRMRWPGGLYLS